MTNNSAPSYVTKTMFDDHEYANDDENASSLARWPEAIDAWRLFLGRTNPSSAGAPAGAARHHDYTIESGAARVLVPSRQTSRLESTRVD